MLLKLSVMDAVLSLGVGATASDLVSELRGAEGVCEGDCNIVDCERNHHPAAATAATITTIAMITNPRFFETCFVFGAFPRS